MEKRSIRFQQPVGKGVETTRRTVFKIGKIMPKTEEMTSQ